jgi:DNA-binding NarL/FixJ family response regulator
MNRKILLVTERPPLIAGFFQLLHRAGLGNEFAIVSPTELALALTSQDTCLVVIDTEPWLDWEELIELRRSHADSLFVLWCSRITPELAWSAVDAGVNGLLSTKLPLEEASQALVQICRGERYFRFEPNLEHRSLTASRAYGRAPFDAAWMFTAANMEQL